jgi:hypothetical protein
VRRKNGQEERVFVFGRQNEKRNARFYAIIIDVVLKFPCLRFFLLFCFFFFFFFLVFFEILLC